MHLGKNLFQETFCDKAVEEALSYLEEKKNSCGVDGMYLSELRDYWKINRSAILSELESGTYEPGMVRIREILSREGKRRRISLFIHVSEKNYCSPGKFRGAAAPLVSLPRRSAKKAKETLIYS